MYSGESKGSIRNIIYKVQAFTTLFIIDCFSYCFRPFQTGTRIIVFLYHNSIKAKLIMKGVFELNKKHQDIHAGNAKPN